MSNFSPQVVLQTLFDPFAPVSGAPTVPTVKVVSPTGDVYEGTKVQFVVQRTNNIAGGVAVDWSATAPSGDLAGTVSGTALLAAGVNAVTIALDTVDRAGLQAEPRQVRVTLSNPNGGAVDPAATFVDIPIRNRTLALPTWYNLPRRSGRAWASGTALLTGTLASDPNTPLEQSVALNDAGFGHSRGAADARVGTWDNVIGGPVGGALLTTGTQFDWAEGSSFGLHFLRSPLGTVWLVWNMVLIPTANATNGGNAAIWAEISAGTHDAKFQAMGARIKSAFATKGHDLARFIGVPHPGMNAGGYYQVFDTTRLAYKAAMERAMAQLRTGAAATLRFAHFPSPGPWLGNFLEWTPNTVDAVGLSYAPDNTVTDAASLRNLIDGTGEGLRYGLTTDLLDAADKLNVPVMIPQWAVHHEANVGCPYAAEAVAQFRAFLQSQSTRVVCDCVSNLAILNAGGYLASGTSTWAQAVTNYDTSWDGIKSGAAYTPPVISITANVASVNEGDA